MKLLQCPNPHCQYLILESEIKYMVMDFRCPRCDKTTISCFIESKMKVDLENKEAQCVGKS